MFNLPLFVGIDYHQETIQVCVMDQTRKILANRTAKNDPEAVFRVVAPYGSNVPPHWRAMANRLRANGKKTCVIVAAVANRWIRKLFHQMCESTPSGDATIGFSRHDQKSILESAVESKPSDAGTQSPQAPEVGATGTFLEPLSLRRLLLSRADVRFVKRTKQHSAERKKYSVYN